MPTLSGSQPPQTINAEFRSGLLLVFFTTVPERSKCRAGRGVERTFLEEVKTRLSDQSEQHLVLTAHQAVNALQAEHLTELRDIMQTVRTLVNTVETQRHQIDQLYSQVTTLQVENVQFKQFFAQLGFGQSQ